MSKEQKRFDKVLEMNRADYPDETENALEYMTATQLLKSGARFMTNDEYNAMVEYIQGRYIGFIVEHG